MTTNEQISDMVVDQMVDELETALKAHTLPAGERATITRGGKLKDSPEDARLYVLVHVNDPEDPDAWQDISLSAEGTKIQNRAFDATPFEIGGASSFWRRFTVEFGLFATKRKDDRDDARRVANLVKGRIERIIATSESIPGLTDTLGEQAVKIIHASSMIEEGTSTFVWRGKVRFQVLTWRAY